MCAESDLKCFVCRNRSTPIIHTAHAWRVPWTGISTHHLAPQSPLLVWVAVLLQVVPLPCVVYATNRNWNPGIYLILPPQGHKIPALDCWILILQVSLNLLHNYPKLYEKEKVIQYVHSNLGMISEIQFFFFSIIVNLKKQ
jgi:hypothetical protein